MTPYFSADSTRLIFRPQDCIPKTMSRPAHTKWKNYWESYEVPPVLSSQKQIIACNYQADLLTGSIFWLEMGLCKISNPTSKLAVLRSRGL